MKRMWTVKSRTDSPVNEHLHLHKVKIWGGDIYYTLDREVASLCSLAGYEVSVYQFVIRADEPLAALEPLPNLETLCPIIDPGNEYYANYYGYTYYTEDLDTIEYIKHHLIITHPSIVILGDIDTEGTIS